MVKRIASVAALVLVGAGALWLATFGSFRQEVRQSVAAGYPLPAFRLPVLDSALFTGDTTFLGSESLRGKVVLLTWWAPDLPGVRIGIIGAWHPLPALAST